MRLKPKPYSFRGTRGELISLPFSVLRTAILMFLGLSPLPPSLAAVSSFNYHITVCVYSQISLASNFFPFPFLHLFFNWRKANVVLVSAVLASILQGYLWFYLGPTWISWAIFSLEDSKSHLQSLFWLIWEHLQIPRIRPWIFWGANIQPISESSVQFSSVCDPIDCSIPGFPVHHQLPELALIHAHWVSDAIQPSHPLLFPSPPALNLSQHQGFLQWVSSLHQVAKVLGLQLQHQVFQWIFRTDLL